MKPIGTDHILKGDIQTSVLEIAEQINIFLVGLPQSEKKLKEELFAELNTVLTQLDSQSPRANIIFRSIDRSYRLVMLSSVNGTFILGNTIGNFLRNLGFSPGEYGD